MDEPLPDGDFTEFFEKATNPKRKRPRVVVYPTAVVLQLESSRQTCASTGVNVIFLFMTMTMTLTICEARTSESEGRGFDVVTR